MLLRPEIICLRIYRVINITEVTVLWMHISNGETQNNNFGVKTCWEDWDRRVTLKESIGIQSVRQKVEWTGKRSCPIVSSGTGSVESSDFTTTVSNYKGEEQLRSTLKASKQDKYIVALPLPIFILRPLVLHIFCITSCTDSFYAVKHNACWDFLFCVFCRYKCCSETAEVSHTQVEHDYGALASTYTACHISHIHILSTLVHQSA